MDELNDRPNLRCKCPLCGADFSALTVHLFDGEPRLIDAKCSNCGLTITLDDGPRRANFDEYSRPEDIVTLWNKLTGKVV